MTLRRSELRHNKIAIRKWLRNHWSTDDIIRALERSQLAYLSCQCLVGFPSCSVKKELGAGEFCGGREHMTNIRHTPEGKSADWAYNLLAFGPGPEQETRRFRLLRPMLKAELKRRMRLAIDTTPEAVLEFVGAP